MTKRTATLLALALSFLVFFALSPFGNNAPDDSALPEQANKEQLFPYSPNEVALSRTAKGSQAFEVKFIDEVTGSSIPHKIHFFDSEGNNTDILNNGAFVTLPRLEEFVACEISFPDESILHRSLKEGWIGVKDDRVIAEIPLYSGVRISAKVHNDIIEDPETFLTIFQDPNTSIASLDNGFRGPFDLEDPDLTQNGLAKFLIRAGRLPQIQGAFIHPTFQDCLLVPAEGLFLAHWQFPDAVTHLSEIRLTPGEIIDLNVQAHPRPILRGILVDWDGDFVPNSKLSITTALNLNDYGLNNTDSCGLVAYRRDGKLYQAAKFQVVTNEVGRFKLPVPNGLGYCIESHALGGYAFYSTDDTDLPFSLDEDVTVRLIQPIPENMVEVSLAGQSDEVLKMARISIALPGDLPFFRQWPAQVPVDKDLSIRHLGIQPGDEIAVFVYHDNLQSGMYVPPYLVVPSSRKVLIHIDGNLFQDP
ncbi:MAG: hypothetical protein ACPG31_09630 [Planctomycetota bacterium]